jgi:parvulin-like peptidyl-prolyl isomerase
MKYLREPLLHFLLVGTALFALYQWAGEKPEVDSQEIVVSPSQIEHGVSVFEMTWGRPPDEMEKQQVIDEIIRDEVYYREALAMGLDKNDDGIRARMRSKLEFISQDVSSIEEPGDETLRAFMEAHPDDYPADPQIAFRQVFLSLEGSAADINARINLLREQLQAGVAETDIASLGDQSGLPSEFDLKTLAEIKRMFGRRFAEETAKLEPNQWSGLIESDRGIHFVYVTERREGGLADLDDVRELVKMAWLDTRRAELMEQSYERMRSKYTVEIETADNGKPPSSDSNVTVAQP